MSDVLLYDYYRSSASYRVRIALNLKNVIYTVVETSLLDGAHKAPDYLVRNPQGLVPMLSIDGHDLTQSLAIIDYLDAKYPDPPMVSAEPAKRAQTLSNALVIAADIHPVNNLRILKYLKSEFGQDQSAVDAWYRHWVVEGLDALEQLAPESGFFGGAHPDLSDVCLVPQIYNARRFETNLSAYPKLVRIDAACNEIKAFQDAHPDKVNGAKT